MLCSPLAEHSLDSLHSIVSRPFQAPRPGHDDGHHGVDLAYFREGDRLSILGEPVQALLPGRVVGVIADRPPYGNTLIVETLPADLPAALRDLVGQHDDLAVFTLYAHLRDEPGWRIGDSLTCGQTIGAVGSSGWSGNPHLHLELRVGPKGTRLPGMAYYDTGATEAERDHYALWRMSGTYVPLDPMHWIELYLTPSPAAAGTVSPAP